MPFCGCDDCKHMMMFNNRDKEKHLDYCKKSNRVIRVYDFGVYVSAPTPAWCENNIKKADG